MTGCRPARALEAKYYGRAAWIFYYHLPPAGSERIDRAAGP